jgi:hypothetical protein
MPILLKQQNNNKNYLITKFKYQNFVIYSLQTARKSSFYFAFKDHGLPLKASEKIHNNPKINFFEQDAILI